MAPIDTTDTTESVIRRMLQAASAEVATSEAAALRDDPDGVHRHRTRVRRLRAVLNATRRIVASEDVEPLRAALRDWGHALGSARDAEVRAAQAEKALTAAGADDADARRHLVGDERAQYRHLHERLVELEATPEGQLRQQLLRECGLELRVTSDGGPADVVERMLTREARRVRRAARRLDGSLAEYHELRKAGRRLRDLADAADAAAPGLLGEAPHELAKAGKRIHRVLGDHRDLTFLADLADQKRSDAFRAQEATAPYDVVATAARAEAEARLHELPKALRRAKKATRLLRQAA